MARAHHYTFAHVALRGFCESSPLRFFGVMASDKRDEFIRHVWSMVCDQCDEREKTDLVPEDIEITCCRARGFPTVIVEMPAAKFVTEAVMVGIVLLVDDDEEEPSEEILPFRYFTLEFGNTFEGSSRTVFCEWTREGHCNMGFGPEPDVRSFIEAIGDCLRATASDGP
jgi:hypothetical protein